MLAVTDIQKKQKELVTKFMKDMKEKSAAKREEEIYFSNAADLEAPPGEICTCCENV